MRLVLLNMAAFVRQDAKPEMALANEDRVPKREADHSRAEKTGLKRSASEHWILGKRKRIDDLHPDSFGSSDSNTAGVFKGFRPERRSDSQRLIRLSLRACDCSRE